ncbi:MAG: fructosamine kinase family protein [Microthrixaceae bacterium]
MPPGAGPSSTQPAVWCPSPGWPARPGRSRRARSPPHAGSRVPRGPAGTTGAPSLLHGDLWAGNRLVDGEGDSWLIDPACFGGHREYDLSMMRLFGGFGAEVERSYDDSHPLAAGFEDRVPLHQLAPLVVHAIKFSGPYVAATGRAVEFCLGRLG